MLMCHPEFILGQHLDKVLTSFSIFFEIQYLLCYNGK